MNSHPEKFQVLLETVLPSSSEHCGPSSAEVLSMVRSERQRRLRFRGSAALLAVVAINAGALIWNHERVLADRGVQIPVKSSPLVIRQVNDEELLALLQETPSALMELPNGGRRLLIIEPSSPP